MGEPGVRSKRTWELFYKACLLSDARLRSPFMAHPCGHALVCVRARVQTEEFNAALAAREAALYRFSRALVRAKVGSGSEGIGGGSRFGLGPVASHRGLVHEVGGLAENTARALAHLRRSAGRRESGASSVAESLALSTWSSARGSGMRPLCVRVLDAAAFFFRLLVIPHFMQFSKRNNQ